MLHSLRKRFLTFAAVAALLAMLPLQAALADGGYYGEGPRSGPAPGFRHGPSYNPHPPGPGYNPRPPVVVVPPREPGRVYTPPPRDDRDNEEIEVTKLLVYVMRGKACDRAGEVLRDMSNLLMSSARFSARPGSAPPAAVIVRVGEGNEDARRRWAGHVNSPHFWQTVWARLAQMYRQCNRGCFDDGVAVGQISATGYCAASIAVGGLNAPGFLAQGRLPLCENTTFVGCQSGYDQTSSTYQGCSTYASGGYTEIYNQSKSQDCHIDP